MKKILIVSIFLSVFFFAMNALCEQKYDDRTIKAWKEWQDSGAEIYSNKAAALNEKAYEIFKKDYGKIIEEYKRGNVSLVRRILDEKMRQVNLLISDLMNLHPPAKLRNYHNKRLEFFRNQKKCFQILLKKDSSANADFNKDSFDKCIDHCMDIERQALNEYRRVAVREHLPKELIDLIDGYLRKVPSGNQ